MEEREKKRVVWVIGHKNPDTDSVCAAIAYADLKNKSEDGTFIPKRAGSLNQETRYVLDRFHVQEPERISDVGAQVKDINYRRSEGIGDHYSLRKAWELMRELDVVTLPVVNEHRHLEGLIANSDIAYSYMDILDHRILGRARTQYRNIAETVHGNVCVGNIHAYFTRGKVVVATGNRDAMRKEIEKDDLVILGNIKLRQMIALECDASCMIICGESKVDGEVQALAEKKECVLITTPFDSFTTARLIHQSVPIRYFMTTEGIISFQLDDYVDYVKDVMAKVRHRDFPILDEQRYFVGMMSRRHLFNMQKKQVILVDHNEKMQAVDGIDQADILEIIDHHRLGSLETLSPIFFRNQPLGSTSTIIYQMYQEKGVEVKPHIAGLLCAAILSDTLMFRSPTCTPADEAAAKALAKIAGVQVQELAASMFEAGSDFSSKTTEEIFYQDFKTFVAGDVSFGVAQVSAVSDRQLSGIKEALKAYLPSALEDKSLRMCFVMLTDILNEATELLYTGKGAKETVMRAFPEHFTGDSFWLPGVVSRKKQLIPAMIEALLEE